MSSWIDLKQEKRILAEVLRLRASGQENATLTQAIEDRLDELLANCCEELRTKGQTPAGVMNAIKVLKYRIELDKPGHEHEAFVVKTAHSFMAQLLESLKAWKIHARRLAHLAPQHLDPANFSIASPRTLREERKKKSLDMQR